MAVIDTYIAELDGAVPGFADVKADLLAEARDSLVDAVEAYEAAGFDRVDAERQAVEDVGAVAEVAPGSQDKLNLQPGAADDVAAVRRPVRAALRLGLRVPVDAVVLHSLRR